MDKTRTTIPAVMTPAFGRSNLFYMIRFAETFAEARIVHALSEQLSWTHLSQIIYLDHPLQRELCAQELKGGMR